MDQTALLAELDARQDDVLLQLDLLSARIEEAIRTYAECRTGDRAHCDNDAEANNNDRAADD